MEQPSHNGETKTAQEKKTNAHAQVGRPFGLKRQSDEQIGLTKWEEYLRNS